MASAASASINAMYGTEKIIDGASAALLIGTDFTGNIVHPAMETRGFTLQSGISEDLNIISVIVTNMDINMGEFSASSLNSTTVPMTGSIALTINFSSGSALTNTQCADGNVEITWTSASNPTPTEFNFHLKACAKAG